MSRYKLIACVLLCTLLLVAYADANYKVKVENVPGVYGGYYTEVSVTLTPLDPVNDTISLAAFDLAVTYNASRLFCMAVTPGDLYSSCGWEYFNSSVFNSGPGCYYNEPSVNYVRVIAMSELGGAPPHPSCYISGNEVELFTMTFQTSSIISDAFTVNPLNFYWFSESFPAVCTNCSFSSVSGDDSYIAANVTDWRGNTFDPGYNCSGPDAGCSAYTTPYIDFEGGYIEIIGDEEPTNRGDVNLNGSPYEIGDAQTFTNYFIFGLNAFFINVEKQIEATEINCDGITLSVADLVYMIRVIIGDAFPLYNCDNYKAAPMDNRNVALAETYITDTLAFFGVEGYAGQQSCPFELYVSTDIDISGLQARIEFDPTKLTPSFDETIGDGESVEFELLGRAVSYTNHGSVLVESREPGVILIYMVPADQDNSCKIPYGSGPVLAVNFDVNEDIQPFDSSLFAFVTEGYDYNLFSDMGGMAIFPELVNGYFVGYPDMFAFFGAEGYPGQQNIPFEFFVVNTDSVVVVNMVIEYDPAYITPSFDPDSMIIPWGIGMEVEHELMGRASDFEDEGTSVALVGSPEPGKLVIRLGPWSDIWYDLTTIEPGVGPIIKVFFDVNPPLLPLRSSPVHFDPDGIVMTGWDYLNIWPIVTSDSTFTVIREPAPPSCPVLFTYNGQGFVQDNPLLTACERTHYISTVTDFYHVTTPVKSEDGRVRFQIREMEDEITYLESVELITVDHDATSTVACAVDGGIYTYKDIIEPLTAVDHRGIDCLSAVRAVDGNYYVSKEPGYLTVTFPNSTGKDIGYNISTSLKPRCLILDTLIFPKTVPIVDENRSASNMTVAFLDNDGNWVESPDIPTREKITTETVTCDPELTVGQDVITLRISWESSYATDVVNQFIVAEETPLLNTWNVSEYDFAGVPLVGKDYLEGQTLQLVKGETFEFSFDCRELIEPSLERDYIIKVIGRYQPDYSIYDNLVPGGFQLYDNYPNPFNPNTIISYDLPDAAYVKLEIFNLLGRKVATLVDGVQEAGHKQVEWRSTDDSGRKVSSGIYLYRLTAGDFAQSRKMILLK
ncbi:MAG: T9SS type A sorting domain-containing protein [candidate division Zixibacteria bacterium]|nr:T9SS type A sorting domain-containing protein [candidate division Zixibacteria bacterium]